MNIFTPTTIRQAMLATSLLLLAACSATSGSKDNIPQNEPVDVGVLIFGDGGYHLMYPDQDDFVDLFSTEEYLQAEWDAWVEDKRPEDEFRARPYAISPVTGKTVAATGMDAVSLAMKNYCSPNATPTNATPGARCDFGVMLGDNIYPSGATLGADGKDDAQRFEDNLAKPFGKLVEGDPDYTVYAVMGNHDFETSREGGFAQIEYLEQSPDFYMDGPFYAVKPPAGKGEVELFVIDTNMLLASTTVYEDYLDDNGAEVVTDEVSLPNYFVEPMTEAEKNMAAWLEESLKNSTAKWKIVLAHHPIWSSSGSKFEQGRALREMILPSMCRYADAYLVGHDHTLEVHTDDCSAALGQATAEPLTQVVSGAAAKQRPVNTNFIKNQDLKYPSHETLFAKGLLWGFAHMQINGDQAKVQLLSVPDDGSSTITVEYEYTFNRRSKP